MTLRLWAAGRSAMPLILVLQTLRWPYPARKLQSAPWQAAFGLGLFNVRLLQIMAGARHGGAETFFVDLIGALARRGVEQAAVTRAVPDRIALLRRAGCHVDTARFGPPFDLVTRVKVHSVAAKFKPDVTLAWMNRAASFMPRGAHVAVGRLGGYYDLKYYRRCDALICNTTDIRDFAIAKGWPPSRVFHIPNFCPVGPEAAINRATVDTPDGVKVVLALARLETSKGIDVAIRAVSQLDGVHLWIAGEGSERTNLERLAVAAGIAGRVKFLGWRTDRSALLRAADACVVASRHEPFGNVVVNAWAHGTPLVATRSQGPAVLVQDGTDGLLVPVDNPTAMADSLRRILTDSETARGLAEAGQKRALTEFSEAGVTSQYLDVFTELIRLSGADLPAPRAGA